MGFVSRSVERLRAFAASNDGSLLDDATWASRHKRISQLAWIATAFAVVWAVADRLEAGGLFPLAMAVLLGLASRPGLGRHIRAVAVAATFVCFQIFTSRYVGNVSGLGAIYIVILTFYQDWVPIAFCCVLALGLVVAAAIDPSWLAHNRGFQREAPLTGMGLRAAAIALAAGLAFLIWRNGTQLARDPLTGMLSRAGVERGLDHELAHGRRPVVWVCDVDNFATVNAELGSAAGDALLRHVAAQLRAIANRI